MNVTKNLASSTAPVAETPAPVPVPPSPPSSPPPPPETETPPIPVETPVDSPVVPIVLKGMPAGTAEPVPAAPLPQTRAKTKGMADLVFLVDVSGSRSASHRGRTRSRLAGTAASGQR